MPNDAQTPRPLADSGSEPALSTQNGADASAADNLPGGFVAAPGGLIESLTASEGWEEWGAKLWTASALKLAASAASPRDGNAQAAEQILASLGSLDEDQAQIALSIAVRAGARGQCERFLAMGAEVDFGEDRWKTLEAKRKHAAGDDEKSLPATDRPLGEALRAGRPGMAIWLLDLGAQFDPEALPKILFEATRGLADGETDADRQALAARLLAQFSQNEEITEKWRTDGCVYAISEWTNHRRILHQVHSNDLSKISGSDAQALIDREAVIRHNVARLGRVEAANENRLRRAVKWGSEPSVEHQMDANAMGHALSIGSTRMVLALLDLGVDFSGARNKESGPLRGFECAARLASVETLSALIERGLGPSSSQEWEKAVQAASDERVISVLSGQPPAGSRVAFLTAERDAFELRQIADAARAASPAHDGQAQPLSPERSPLRV
jgi:hypothetical protein